MISAGADRTTARIRTQGKCYRSMLSAICALATTRRTVRRTTAMNTAERTYDSNCPTSAPHLDGTRQGIVNSYYLISHTLHVHFHCRAIFPPPVCTICVVRSSAHSLCHVQELDENISVSLSMLSSSLNGTIKHSNIVQLSSDRRSVYLGTGRVLH
jgi:hypothetical protein